MLFHLTWVYHFIVLHASMCNVCNISILVSNSSFYVIYMICERTQCILPMCMSLFLLLLINSCYLHNVFASLLYPALNILFLFLSYLIVYWRIDSLLGLEGFEFWIFPIVIHLNLLQSIRSDCELTSFKSYGISNSLGVLPNSLYLIKESSAMEFTLPLQDTGIHYTILDW